jgi:hypothetical protein
MWGEALNNAMSEMVGKEIVNIYDGAGGESWVIRSGNR